VVIHWRYALIDTRYVFARVDEETGWGDWSDELYTIYPDGVGVRKITLWSSQPMEPHEFQDTIMIHAPGRRPEDDIESDAVILANMNGDTHTYSWAKGLPAKMDKPPRANIQVTNLKSPTDPFLIVSDAPCAKYKTGPRFQPYRGTYRPEVSMFPWWNHWPVAMIPCDGRNATAPDRASHSCTTNQLEWADYAITSNSRTRVMLHGMTNRPAGDLATLARSWLLPPELKLTSGGATSKGYDRAERAYVLTCGETETSLEFELKASETSPLENIALIVEGWGKADAELTVNDKRVARGEAFRFGHRKRLDGTDLIAWIRHGDRQSTRVTLRPGSTP
jgi:hypothetical protein